MIISLMITCNKPNIIASYLKLDYLILSISLSAFSIYLLLYGKVAYLHPSIIIFNNILLRIYYTSSIIIIISLIKVASFYLSSTSHGIFHFYGHLVLQDSSQEFASVDTSKLHKLSIPILGISYISQMQQRIIK